MITYDAGIPDKFLEEWKREIARYAQANLDNMLARNVLPIRKVSASTQVDVLVEYDKTGQGAQVVAKGAVPGKTSVSATTSKQDIYQLMDSFDLHQKDLKTDPKQYNRLVDICLRNIHRLEDSLAMNGDPNLNLNGIVDAAQSNANGKIVASGATGNDENNHGAWDGSDTSIDIHADIVAAVERLDSNYKPRYLVGNRTDIMRLFTLDSQRQPYYATIAPLFGFSEKDNPLKTWLFETGVIAAGKVYVCAKDPEAAEFVISENPKINRLPMQRGGMYPVEITCWAVPRIYDNEAFVEIATT